MASIRKLEKHYLDGMLTKNEFAEVLEVKQSALDKNNIDIVAYQNADLNTLNEGCRHI